MERIRFIALAIIALVYLGASDRARADGQPPSITVFTQAVAPSQTVALHRNGEAIFTRGRYRVQVASLETGAMVIKVILPGGKEETLFAAPSSPGLKVDLPEGGGWYDLPSEPGNLKIVSVQNGVTAEHLMTTVKPSPGPDVHAAKFTTSGVALTGWKNPISEASAELPQQVSTFTKLASTFASAREPVLRGGLGSRIFRDAASGVVLVIVGDGLGSGVILNQVGQILTNWHVVRGAKVIGVMLKPPLGQRLRPTDMYQAHLKKYDEIADLAIIQLDRPPGNLSILKLGDERGIEVGSTVHAIGHPSGEYWTYTEGVVSQVRTDYEWTGSDKIPHSATVIQTQTPVNPGNSGGPLLDDGPNVIGINSFSARDQQGLNFAISVGDIKRFLSAGGNRVAEAIPAPNAAQKMQKEGCKPRKFDSFVDQKSKKVVLPIDTECRGRPNLYLVSERADKKPEFALIDNVGDGKFDAKIIFEFNEKADLWIFYSRRDGVPTAFGYDYQAKGKPDVVVAINAASQ